MEESMNQLTTHHTPESLYLSEQRINPRHEVISLLAITERGTGQILDISRQGLSFGCLYPHAFPHEFYLDILDAKGSHIKKVKVRKMWEIDGDCQESDAIFELVIGVEFTDLSSSQKDDMDYLLDNIELINYPYQNII
jgi:hypothetical protein